MKFIIEYKKYSILPKELRNMNLLYHSTIIGSFDEIIKTNELYGTHGYDFGVATSRNKHYAFGNAGDDEMHNVGEIQLILDKDKLQNKYKTMAFDWEEWKSTDSKTGEYNDFHQSEDKILTNRIDNIKKYIVGIHIIHNEFNEEVLAICKKYNFYPEYIFDEDWNLIKPSEKFNI